MEQQTAIYGGFSIILVVVTSYQNWLWTTEYQDRDITRLENEKDDEGEEQMGRGEICFVFLGQSNSGIDSWANEGP